MIVNKITNALQYVRRMYNKFDEHFTKHFY